MVKPYPPELFFDGHVTTPYGVDQLPPGEESDSVKITTIKILLAGADIKPTNQNIAIAADWIKTLNMTSEQIRGCSESDKRKYMKALRRAISKGKVVQEQAFMTEVRKAQTGPHHNPLAGSIFDDLLNRVAEMKSTVPSLSLSEERYPHAHEDIKEIARRFTESGIKFERPQGTSLHHFLDDLNSSTYGHADNTAILDFFKNEFHSFVIEHDWARAFEGVKDFDGGEVKLPYAHTCFEFRVNGIRLLVFLGESVNGTIEGIIASGINMRWYINPMRVTFDGNTLQHPDYTDTEFDQYILNYLKMIGAQIRAVCIMLDAGVAVGEKRSIGGDALRKKREREGKAPLRDYHVVSLAKRLRGNQEQGEPTGIQKRLHWRRGHWRHFSTPGGEVRYIDADGITVSKTWINWQLVGNERLGFVDKHYKL